MVAFNKLILAGNLTRDPELRYTNGGDAYAKFGIAVNERYRDQAGETKESVTFVDVTVWGKPAENCAEFLRKGSPALVEGRLRQRRWEQDGQKLSRHELIATTVQFLGSRKGGTPEGQEPPEEDGPF